MEHSLEADLNMTATGVNDQHLTNKHKYEKVKCND